MSEPSAVRPKLPRNVIALGVVSFLMDSSTEMIRPVFPLFLKGVLGAPASLIGLIEGVAESASSILKIASGYISDKLGKRKALIAFGYGASAVAKPLIGLSQNAYQVLGIWFFDRVGKGVRGAPRDAIIADSAPAEIRGRAYGLHRAMDTAGAVLGPLLAMGALWLAARYAVEEGPKFRSVFFLSTVPAVLAVLVLLAFVRERPRGEAAARHRAERQKIGGRFPLLMVFMAIFTLGNSADAFLFLRAANLGVAAALIPGLYVVMNIVYAATSHGFGSLSDRVGRKPLVVGGFLLYALVYSGFALAPSGAVLWGLFPLYGLYYGMTEGTLKALVADIVPAHARGTAFGIYQGVVGLMLLPASVIMGALYDFFEKHYGQPGYAFFLGAVLALVAAAGIMLTVPRKTVETEAR